jgi:hypothetical protein
MSKKTSRVVAVKVGKPVRIGGYLAFLPNKQAEREHAEMFNQERSILQMMAEAMAGRR